MATITLGSNGTTTLTALRWVPGVSAADVATIDEAILSDGSQAGGIANAAPSDKPKWPGAFSRSSGRLFVPNRGVLIILPGDYVAVDANGWPILLSANAIAGGSSPSAATSWTHS